jgi:hypothetical protein
MIPFLVSSAIGFTVYQFVAWAFISDDGRFFRLGDSVVNLSASAAKGLRRFLAVLLIGLALFLAIWLHRPFSEVRGAAILGLFYGPLLAIWINTLIAKPSEDSPSIAQYVAGAGLVLLFLVGSVGDPVGELIQRYAQRISKISVGGAELSFSEKTPDALGGSLSLSGIAPTYASSTGAIGLDYLGRLARMIERDIEYLTLFKENEIRREKAKRNITDTVGSAEFNASIDKQEKEMEQVIDTLRNAKLFAEATIEKPASCLVGWYTATGDADAINRHIAGLAEIFKRLPAIETGHPVDRLARELITRSFFIAHDAVISVPSYLLADKCDDVLEQFCPEAFTIGFEQTFNDLGKVFYKTRKKTQSG